MVLKDSVWMFLLALSDAGMLMRARFSACEVPSKILLYLIHVDFFTAILDLVCSGLSHGIVEPAVAKYIYKQPNRVDPSR